MDAPPLIITADERLREELLRLAAAAGAVPDVAAGVAADPRALRGWARAPAVVVGADQAAALVRWGAPRRAGVTVCWAGSRDAGDEPAVLRAGLALGAERLATLPQDEATVVGALADLGEPDGGGPVLAVVGGAGGAGASVFAAALATRAAARGPTLLADLDPLGPGAGRLLGLGGAGAVGWPDLTRGSGRLGAGALREALPRTRAGVGVLGWPGPATAVDDETLRDALAAAVRGHRAVVLDLPRRELAGRSDLLGRAAAVVVVCVATLTGASATARLLGSGALVGMTPLLVVRGDLQDAARLGRVLGVEPTVAMPGQRRLEESLALGLGPTVAGRAPRGRAGALARAADTVWRAVPLGSPARAAVCP